MSGGVPEELAGSVAVQLARIEAKLDRAIDDHADHEIRIRSLERLVWRTSGAAAAVGVGGGTVAALAVRLIGGVK